MLPKVGVAVLVLNEENVLLGKRKGAHGAGTWSTMGGNLEFGETVIQCAQRELLEETGLTAHHVIEGPWEEVFFPKEKKHYLTVYTFVTQFSGEPRVIEPDKVENWRWFDSRFLPTPLFEPIQKIVRAGSLRFFIQEHLLKKPEVHYLSAPYNHPDPQVRKQRYDLITATASRLIQEKTYVFSPITHNVPIRDLGHMTTWEDWREFDLTMLSLCNKMILLKLPGWQDSRGVQAEILFAQEKNIPIEERNP